MKYTESQLEQAFSNRLNERINKRDFVTNFH